MGVYKARNEDAKRVNALYVIISEKWYLYKVQKIIFERNIYNIFGEIIFKVSSSKYARNIYTKSMTRPLSDNF